MPLQAQENPAACIDSPFCRRARLQISAFLVKIFQPNQPAILASFNRNFRRQLCLITLTIPFHSWPYRKTHQLLEPSAHGVEYSHSSFLQIWCMPNFSLDLNHSPLCHTGNTNNWTRFSPKDLRRKTPSRHSEAGSLRNESHPVCFAHSAGLPCEPANPLSLQHEQRLPCYPKLEKSPFIRSRLGSESKS